jgi:hypothetical protein
MIDALLSFRENLGEIFSPWLGLIEFISAVISLALLAGIIYVAIKLNVFGKKIAQFTDVTSHLDLTKRRTVRAWTQIQKRVQAGDESNLKLAVIEADKVMDEILKRSGFAGETMADRLKGLNTAQLSNLQQVWEAHKLRNRIVHEPDFEVSKKEAEYAVSIYGRAFQEFGLID